MDSNIMKDPAAAQPVTVAQLITWIDWAFERTGPVCGPARAEAHHVIHHVPQAVALELIRTYDRWALDVHAEEDALGGRYFVLKAVVGSESVTIFTEHSAPRQVAVDAVAALREAVQGVVA